MLTVAGKRQQRDSQGNVPFDHSHSQQQPVHRGFPLFKHCEWLVVNRDVAKQTSPDSQSSPIQQTKQISAQ